MSTLRKKHVPRRFVISYFCWRKAKVCGRKRPPSQERLASRCVSFQHDFHTVTERFPKWCKLINTPSQIQVSTIFRSWKCMFEEYNVKSGNILLTVWSVKILWSFLLAFSFWRRLANLGRQRFSKSLSKCSGASMPALSRHVGMKGHDQIEISLPYELHLPHHAALSS